MAGSGWEDVKDMASWAYNRATSRPIGRIETTLATGRAAPRGGKSLSEAVQPVTDLYERAKTYVSGTGRAKPTAKSRSAAPESMARSKRRKSPSKGRR